mmetsp:Transcript_129680/g.415977  ORF Transcript_129680/g.415977 Transcript_129680/m.415977 type:complete len:284 (+) Transcript_129680:446-1297(+)
MHVPELQLGTCEPATDASAQHAGAVPQVPVEEGQVALRVEQRKPQMLLLPKWDNLSSLLVKLPQLLQGRAAEPMLDRQLVHELRQPIEVLDRRILRVCIDVLVQRPRLGLLRGRLGVLPVCATPTAANKTPPPQDCPPLLWRQQLLLLRQIADENLFTRNNRPARNEPVIVTACVWVAAVVRSAESNVQRNLTCIFGIHVRVQDAEKSRHVFQVASADVESTFGKASTKLLWPVCPEMLVEKATARRGGETQHGSPRTLWEGQKLLSSNSSHFKHAGPGSRRK